MKGLGVSGEVLDELESNTDEMTKATSDHGLKGLGSRGGVASDHRVGRHDGADWSGPRVESISDDLYSVLGVSKRVITRSDQALTLKARSFAVKIPQRCSSSSTTNTQSVLLAAQS